MSSALRSTCDRRRLVAMSGRGGLSLPLLLAVLPLVVGPLIEEITLLLLLLTAPPLVRFLRPSGTTLLPLLPLPPPFPFSSPPPPPLVFAVTTLVL